MDPHKFQFYLLEQHNESFNIWSAIITINIESKSLILKSSPVFLLSHVKHPESV